VDFVIENFRHAEEILAADSEWQDIQDVIRSIGENDVLDVHEALNRPLIQADKAGIAGGQTAINELFRRKLLAPPRSWEGEPRLFASRSRDLSGWKMDFLKDRVGVEVSFNHAEAIPWTFTRLNIAGESESVVEEHRIDVGIAIFADKELKAWARMDQSVGVFDKAWLWLTLMKPIMPVPILVVGLLAKSDGIAWTPASAFRGTARGTRRAARQTTAVS
jgi:hypothetical protein